MKEQTNKHKWLNKTSHVTNKDCQPWQICQPYICPLGSKTVSVSPSLFFTLIFLLLPPQPSHSSLSALSVCICSTLLHQKAPCQSISSSSAQLSEKASILLWLSWITLPAGPFNTCIKTTKITWMMKHTVSSTVAGVMQMHHFHYIWQMTQLYK